MTAEIELEDITDLDDINPLVLLATAPSKTTLELFDDEGNSVMKDVMK
jgi:hypothetical protein